MAGQRLDISKSDAYSRSPGVSANCSLWSIDQYSEQDRQYCNLSRTHRWGEHPDANDSLCQQRYARNSLVTYANKLPADASDGEKYNLQALVGYLLEEAKSNFSSNSKVIPVLQALNALLEADVLERLCDSEAGTRR